MSNLISKAFSLEHRRGKKLILDEIRASLNEEILILKNSYANGEISILQFAYSYEELNKSVMEKLEDYNDNDTFDIIIKLADLKKFIDDEQAKEAWRTVTQIMQKALKDNEFIIEDSDIGNFLNNYYNSLKLFYSQGSLNLEDLKTLYSTLNGISGIRGTIGGGFLILSKFRALLDGIKAQIERDQYIEPLPKES